MTRLKMAAVYMYISFVLLISALVSGTSSLRPKRGFLRSPPAPKDAKVAQAQWFVQELDHTNSSDTRTWLQRFFFNDSSWERASGPVFLMLGGEGPADPVWLTVGDMTKNAVKFKALTILLEHRYYGMSHPTEDLSTNNLKYLSSRQAIEDVVSFRARIVSAFNLTEKNKWISFGGSYSGALSAWLRLKHPEAVAAAVATSAPVRAQEDFSQYLEVVGQSLATTAHGTECVSAIQEATNQVDEMLRDKSKWNEVEKVFHVHPALRNYDDVYQLSQSLAGNFMGVVQYNRDNTEFEGRVNNVTIDTLCGMMANTSLGSPVQRYAAVNQFSLDEAKMETLDANFSASVAEMRNTSWNSSVAGGERQWFYQTCTEFGYFQTTTSQNQPFGQLIPISSYTDICSNVYGISPEQIADFVNSTNQFYKGREIPAKEASNIVFPNGSIDPWHALGIIKDISNSLQAIYIEGTAHCANMYPARDSDLPSLVKAREEISSLIGQWLDQ